MAPEGDETQLGEDEDVVLPELMQLLMETSIRRYLPAMGTTGLVRNGSPGKDGLPNRCLARRPARPGVALFRPCAAFCPNRRAGCG